MSFTLVVPKKSSNWTSRMYQSSLLVMVETLTPRNSDEALNHSILNLGRKIGSKIKTTLNPELQPLPTSPKTQQNQVVCLFELNDQLQ